MAQANLAELERDRLQERHRLQDFGSPSALDDAPEIWVSLRQDGPRAQLWTGPRALRYQRVQILAVGLAFVVGGGALLTTTHWAWLAVAIGPLLLVLAPRLAPARALVEIDRDAGLLTPLAGSGAEGGQVALAAIKAVAGAWETFGWSSRSAVYAVAGDGARSLVLSLGGTNDAYAVAACGALGQLLGVRSEYTGPSGAAVRCGDDPVG